jgi:hypothetical protein
MKNSMLVIVFLVASGSASAQTAYTHPLYPLNLGDKWTYRVTDLKVAPAKTDKIKRTVVEVARPETYSQKDAKGVVTNHVGFILKSTSGDKISEDHVVLLAAGGVFRVTLAGTPITPPWRILKLPLDNNEKWDINSVCGNEVIKGTYTWRREDVKVPSGAYEKAVVTVFSNNKKGQFDRVEVESWYANDVGMVKQRILQKGHEHVLELEKYQPTKK